MYRNNEHYPDPTFGEAYSNIRRAEKAAETLPWVYIASPYRGDVEKNTAAAEKYAAFAARQNKIPLCPHIYFTRFLDDNNEAERRKGLNFAMQWLKHCDEMWVFGSRISSGMKAELDAARTWNIPIRFFDENCREAAAR